MRDDEIIGEKNSTFGAGQMSDQIRKEERSLASGAESEEESKGIDSEIEEKD